MKIVIEIPKFAWIEDIKDFKSAVKEYDKGSAFDHAIREALLLGEPLPEHHGDLIDRSEVIVSLFDYCKGKKTIGQCIDDVQTIIGANKESESK